MAGNRDASVGFRIESEYYEYLSMLAEQDGRKRIEYIRHIILKEIKKEMAEK